MVQSLSAWLDSDVRPAEGKSLRWLSEQHFFRDPVRPLFSDSNYFFSPADGILLYQRVVEAGDAVVEIKGRNYTLKEAIRDPNFDMPCVIFGIFMTSYDVHINRLPYSGFLSYRELPAIETCNRPMLVVEERLMRGHAFSGDDAEYLFANQRMLNRIRAPRLGIDYFVLQIADYDVSTVMPFELRQHRPAFQNQRFSQIRFGSQVDLVIPLSPTFDIEFCVPDGEYHVQAGVDALARVRWR